MQLHSSIAKATPILPLKLFVKLRWWAILGQLLAVLGVKFILGFSLPLAPLLMVIGLSIIINCLTIRLEPLDSRLPSQQVPIYLLYDLGQLTTLLFLTGGLNNPFCLLLVAPICVAAGFLSHRSIMLICGCALLAVLALGFSPYPLPWVNQGLVLDPFLRFGIAMSLLTACLFITFYVWGVARAVHQLSHALSAVQLSLAQEQKISSLGALAAAIAHELGSPLTTINIAAKESLRQLSLKDSCYEDMHLIAQEASRCQEILKQLSKNNEYALPIEHLPISAFMQMIGEKYQVPGISFHIETPQPAINNLPEPLIMVKAEMLHALGNIVQNAFHFAKTYVKITISWHQETLHMLIKDDGAGYPAAILPHLGSPYVSARTPADAAVHLGLGVFIASTLIQQQHGTLKFYNDAGACCAIDLRI